MGLKNNYRVLLIGGHSALTQKLGDDLDKAGFGCVPAADGNVALQQLRDTVLDLVLIAMSNNDNDGASICKMIASESAIPMIAVSELGNEQECIDMLSAGADDYMAGAPGSRELSARMLAAIRRAKMDPYPARSIRDRSLQETDGVLKVGSVRLDLHTCRVSVNGNVRTLTPNEFRLLAVFLRAPGEVFTREDLRKRVWPDDQHSLHLVEVHIANLRVKIENDPHHPDFIITVRSRGYRFAVQA